jgi:hypothetical protein
MPSRQQPSPLLEVPSLAKHNVIVHAPPSQLQAFEVSTFSIAPVSQGIRFQVPILETCLSLFSLSLLSPFAHASYCIVSPLYIPRTTLSAYWRNIHLFLFLVYHFRFAWLQSSRGRSGKPIGITLHLGHPKISARLSLDSRGNSRNTPRNSRYRWPISHHGGQLRH